MAAQLAQLPVFSRLSALGDGTRTRLLSLLEENELTVGELCAATLLPQSTVSRHLRILVDDGWLSTRSEGTSRFYRLAPELEGTARELWSVVRERIHPAGECADDAERVRSVLAARRDDSRRFFEREAASWDDLRQEFYGAGVESLPLLGLLDPGWVVGDLGCGTGALSSAIAPFAHRVHGVDRSPEMLGVARGRAERLGLGHEDGLEFHRADLEDLPFADGALDVAVLSLVLHYVRDPAAVVSEAARATRPGGRIVSLDMRRHGREELREEMGHVWLGFTTGELERWLSEAGCGDVRTVPVAPAPGARGPLLQITTAVRHGPPQGTR